MGKSTFFDALIERIRNFYTRFIRWTVNHPRRVVLTAMLVSLPMFATVLFIPKTFLPSLDSGEMRISLELPPGSDLESSKRVALKAEQVIRENKEVEYTSTIAGNDRGDPTFIEIYTKLVPSWKRIQTTRQVKERIREQLKPFSSYRVKIGEYDALFGGDAPFNLTLRSDDPVLLEQAAKEVLELMKENPGFVEADIDARPGKPEMRLQYDEEKTKLYGVSTRMAGAELRTQMEGMMPAKFRELGKEWDIRVRLRDEDRDLRSVSNVVYCEAVVEYLFYYCLHHVIGKSYKKFDIVDRFFQPAQGKGDGAERGVSPAFIHGLGDHRRSHQLYVAFPCHHPCHTSLDGEEEGEKPIVLLFDLVPNLV